MTFVALLDQQNHFAVLFLFLTSFPSCFETCTNIPRITGSSKTNDTKQMSRSLGQTCVLSFVLCVLLPFHIHSVSVPYPFPHPFHFYSVHVHECVLCKVNSERYCTYRCTTCIIINFGTTLSYSILHCTRSSQREVKCCLS